jgi:hypothetical protein
VINGRLKYFFLYYIPNICIIFAHNIVHHEIKEANFISSA